MHGPEHRKSQEQELVGIEYDRYQKVKTLQTIGLEVFGDEYVGQESSVAPSYLADLLKEVGVNSFHRIIDLGCGKGGLTIAISKRLQCEMVGVDTSRESIAVGESTIRNNNEGARCQFLVADLDNLPPQNQFDGILSVGSLYWLATSPDKLISSWDKLLRPPLGAVIILITRILKEPSIRDLNLLQRGLFVPFIEWEEILKDNGYMVSIKDNTDDFLSWLLRWNTSLSGHRDELIQEMGASQGKIFLDKFQLMEDYAHRDLITRKEIIARRF